MNIVEYNDSIKNVCIYIIFGLLLVVALIFFPNDSPTQFSICKFITILIILYAGYILLKSSFTYAKDNTSELLDNSEMKKTILFNTTLVIFIVLLLYVFVRY